MNQTELPECEKINKKEPSKDVQMTQEQADRLVEHLKNVFMYVRVRSEILLSMKRMASCVNATQYGTKRCRALTVFPKKPCGRNRRNQNWNALRRMCIRSLQDTWRSKENHA